MEETVSERQNRAIDLSIVVPAYNEAAALPAAIAAVMGYLDDRALDGELIVVDDGSADETRAIAEAAAEGEDRIRVEGYARNRGKGHAVRHGVAAARGEVIVFLDADLATPVEETDRALAAIADGADVVVGTRFHAEAEIERPQPWLRRFMGGRFRWLARAMLGLSESDITCGFKAFTREAARALFGRSTIDGWAFDAELLVIARRLGLRVVEVPVRWSDSRDSRVRPLANAVESWRQLMQIRRRLREGAYDPRGETMAE